MLICLRGLIVSMSEEYGLINDGLVTFDDTTGLIEDVTRWDKRSTVKCDLIEGDEYAIVMPGLINTHTHAPMLILQGLGAGLTGFDWLRKIWCVEGLLKPEHVYVSTKASILLMLENGITTFADQYFYEEEVVKAVEESGVRGVLAKGVVEYSEHAPKHTIEDSINFASNFNGVADGRVKTMIGVHAMYSCSVETILKAVEFSKKSGIRIHMHFSESLHELEYIKSRYGTTPTGLAAKLGILQARPLLAHAVYLDDEDIRVLSEHEVYVAYSPFTIMSWGQDIARIGELVERGVTTSLATDGPVTDGDLSLFKQVKIAIAAQSSRYRTPGKLQPREALEMITKKAAKSLGIEKLVGALKPGMKADIIVLKPPRTRIVGLREDPYSTIAYNLGDESINDVYLNGRKLVSGKKPLKIDIEKLYEKLLELRRELFEEAVTCNK